MAVNLHETGTSTRKHGKTVKLCANGCGQPAVARDLTCNKDVCWFHLVMEHPYTVVSVACLASRMRN